MITVFALIRLIPYLLVAIVSWKAGYPRLTIFAAYLFFAAVTIHTFQPDKEVIAIMSTINALLLLWHAVDLKARR